MSTLKKNSIIVDGRELTKSQFRKRIIKNLISTVLDKEGKLIDGAEDRIDKQYIRQKHDAFKVHRTTRRSEINEVLIEEGFL